MWKRLILETEARLQSTCKIKTKNSVEIMAALDLSTGCPLTERSVVPYVIVIIIKCVIVYILQTVVFIVSSAGQSSVAVVS